jgi:hypothetical protein
LSPLLKYSVHGSKSIALKSSPFSVGGSKKHTSHASVRVNTFVDSADYIKEISVEIDDFPTNYSMSYYELWGDASFG